MISKITDRTQYAETAARLPLCRNKKTIRRNYCAFWKANNSGDHIEEFAEILKRKFSE